MSLPNDGPVWAITSYFAPCGSRMRLANYREFRQRLGLPLVAVELAYGPSFDLRAGDADVLLQRRSGALLWQKERLLNLALSALPDSCDTVVWVDCDQVFLRKDWVEAGRSLLDEFALVQLFGRLHHLSRGEGPGEHPPSSPIGIRRSLVSLVAQRQIPDEAFSSRGANSQWKYVPGGAWMARRSLLAQSGIYDADILGSGDKLLASAALGRHRDAVEALEMNPRQRMHYSAWAEPFFEVVGGRVAHVDGDLIHLWHGSLENRQYASRYDGFRQLDFDPYADIAVNGDGVWRWNSNKPELHSFLRRYFESRKDA